MNPTCSTKIKYKDWMAINPEVTCKMLTSGTCGLHPAFENKL